MRIRLPLGRTLFFVCAFLFALVALLPMRLALDWLSFDERGFAAREAKGSIWLGAVSEAQWGNVALGDLRAGLRALPLFVGRARIDLRRDDEAEPFNGSVTIARHLFGIDDLMARLDMGSALAPLPIGSLDTSDLSVRFDDGLCSRAEGSVKAGIVTDIAGLPLRGGMSGNARCDKGALLLPLVGQSGMEALNIRMRENGAYEIQLTVKPLDDSMRDRLVATGFKPGAGNYVLTAIGRF
jgi:general secretion pathway protein N